MSYLGQTITRLIEENGVTQKWIESKTGLQQSTISRLKNGQQTSICREHLALLAGASGRNKFQQAELIAAHLRDECHGPGSELIEIKIRGESRAPANTQFGTKLPERTEKALIFLANLIPVRSGVEQLILGLAQTFGWNCGSPQRADWASDGTCEANSPLKTRPPSSPSAKARRADVCTAK